MSNRGLFIVIEGADGAGKSTCCHRLWEWLEARREQCSILTQGLGGSLELGNVLRHTMLNEGRDLSAMTRCFLSLADRRQHLVDTVGPALARGQHVICDRGWASNVVYQGFAGGQNWAFILDMERAAASGNCGDQRLWPDLTLVLDCPGAVAMPRVVDPNHFESLGLTFQQRVRDGYRELAISEHLPFVNANQPVADVFALVLEHVRPLLGGGDGTDHG